MRTHVSWPRIKVAGDSKKRRVRIMRPTLKKLDARMRSLNRVRRALRGRLYKTKAGENKAQTEINRALLAAKRDQEALTRYLDAI